MLKFCFLLLFFVLFLYGFFRPFKSYLARILLLLGSSLGFLSVLGEKYTQQVAEFLGIGRAADLFLYLSLITILLFITYTIQKMDETDKKISLLTKKIAIKESLNKYKNS